MGESKLRRKDREVAELERIEAIIARCSCCRIALLDEGAPYIVPLNFGYRREGAQSSFYFHGAAEGRKIDLLRRNPRVGFELDTDHELRAQEKACGYSFSYRSVVGTGVLSLLTGEQEKAAALQAIMAQYTKRGDWTFDAKILRATAVIRLAVEEMSGKERA